MNPIHGEEPMFRLILLNIFLASLGRGSYKHRSF